ncbi:hypothetical protein NUKP88_48140 [Klebsiella variicola]|nr:hypothetical protein NUKP88_48140 [Klebsiella variicola]
MTLPYGVISDPHYHKWDSFSTTDADGLNSRLAIQLEATKEAAIAMKKAGCSHMLVAGDTFHVRGTVSPIRHEFAEYGVTLPDLPLVDTMLSGLWATEDGKRPRLEELAFSLGFVYDKAKAHSALYDTDLMMHCFFKAREKYGFYKLPFESA